MIEEVKINDYSELDEPKKNKVIISEFAGMCVIEIVGGNKAQVYFEDLEKAWRAVEK